MVEFDIAEDMLSLPVAREVLAVSLFLNDGRFPDVRSSQEVDEGYPPSFQNCIPAAMFLAMALNECEPGGRWEGLGGKADYEWHAFVVGHGGRLLADVTGDQFDMAAAVLRPFDATVNYVADEILLDIKSIDRGDWRRVGRWREEWSRTAEDYRLQAEAMLLVPAHSPVRP